MSAAANGSDPAEVACHAKPLEDAVERAKDELERLGRAPVWAVMDAVDRPAAGDSASR